MALIFTTHALRRMRLRGILVREVREALRAPLLVEDYPEDVPYPSRLILRVGQQSADPSRGCR